MHKKRILLIALLLIPAFLLFSLYSFFTGYDFIYTNFGGGEQVSVSSSSYSSGGNLFSQLSPIPSSPIPSVTYIGTAGGGSAQIASLNLRLNLTSLNIDMVNNTNHYETILVTNPGNAPLTVSVSQSNLTGLAMIEGNSTFSLSPGESRTILVMFIGPRETGIYSGYLVIGGQSIPVVLNVQSYLTMFDSQIQVLNPNYIVVQGNALRTIVTLIPQGNTPIMDVTLNYTITDSSGKPYLSNSETLLVKSRLSFERDFDTGQLPEGNYTVYLNLYYSAGTAPSSAHFEIAEKIPTAIGQTIYALILIVVIISIVLVIGFLFESFRKTKDKSKIYNPKYY